MRDALTTITKSPMSRCGEYVGLCLPMSNRATCVASRPSVWPSASRTCQPLSISPALRLYVFVCFVIKQPAFVTDLHQAEPARWRSPARCSGWRFVYHPLELALRDSSPSYFDERRHDPPYHVRQKRVRLDLKRRQTTAAIPGRR